ncbi:MAG: ZIP family metal transporter [Oscillospiraceae bacterium]|nr:ZIP family metal transporter [Oscillospiraceae bacterium]
MIYWIILVTAIAGVGGTGLGGAISACIRRDSSKVVSLLLSFAGGVMLAVVCFDLIMDAVNTELGKQGGLITVLLGIVIGYIVVGVLNLLIDEHTNPELEHIDEAHPKTADDLDELIHSDHLEKHMQERSSLFIAGLIMATAIALHNLPEGMVIGAAYTGQSIEQVWSGSGFVMATLIGLHNIPEGMAVAVPLIAGGMGRGKAIAITALTGFTTVIGAIIGYLLGSMGDFMHVLALSFASGAMLYVVLGELLPESILMWRSKLPAAATMVGIILGMIIIFA